MFFFPWGSLKKAQNGTLLGRLLRLYFLGGDIEVNYPENEFFLILSLTQSLSPPIIFTP